MKNSFIIVVIIFPLCLQAQEIEVKKCNCYMLGTFETPDGKSLCDVSTGKCSCLKNVVGINCDKCKDGYFGLYSGNGCKFCACNMLGALKQECDDISGRCSCKRGFTGHKCEKCQDIFPIINGKCCQCPQSSSTSTSCDKKGRCKCKPHTLGLKCKECEENYYYDEKSGCTPCGPCYNIIKTSSKTYENQLETIKQKLESNNVNATKKDYEKFEDKLTKLKDRVAKLKTEEIKLIDFDVIKSLDDFFLRVDALKAKNKDANKKIKDIDEKYNKTQSKLKSGIKQVEKEKKQIGQLNKLLEKSEVIIGDLEKKVFDDDALNKTVSDVKLIGEETKKLFDDIALIKVEIENAQNFVEEIRVVKNDVVKSLDEAKNFKAKVEGIKVNEIDFETPANNNFVDSVKDRVKELQFKIFDFDPKPLNDKLMKIQGFIDYIEGVKQQNEETVDEFMRIQTNFNFKETLRRLEEIKANIDELNKNTNSANDKINTDVIPNLKLIQENISKLDDLDENELQELIKKIYDYQKKLDAIIETHENLTQSLQAQEVQIKIIADQSRSNFNDDYDAVVGLIADYGDYERDIKEKIAACEDLITFFKAMPMYPTNQREFHEAEIEIETLEKYFEDVEHFTKVKLELEVAVKHIKDIYDGLPEEKNWCGAKDTIT